MASNSNAAHVLMKKGKRGAAAYVHVDCAQSSSPQLLSELLDIILNPVKPIEEWETIDWIKWLLAGGKTPDEFASTVRRYDNATTCGLVWTANFVAYRCRTCGISPCMSLCAECFQKGNHVGHDFNMFRSQAGGACDCGDTSVMKEMGFCDRHGPKAQVNKPSAPDDLMCVAEATMPRIILRLLQHLREHSKSGIPDAYLVAIQDADLYLTMLHDFSAMGAAMRRVMTGALTNPQIYKHLTECFSEDSEYYSYMIESQRVYHEALKSLPNPEPPEEYRDCPSLQEQLIHRTFLEELVFWTVKFEFPQKVVCLLLNMLPDPDYKEALTEAFVLHYSRISMMLERSADPDTLSNRVVHVSVQLFSNECLAFHMAENLNLLHVMVISLKYMMAKILIPNTLHDPSKNTHFVVDCGRHVMKEHCYWPLVSDLNNVLSHRPVAIKFMSDDNLLEMWFSFLSMFQGMNVNQRELTQHVEFEPNTYYAAFSAELEASAYPMWALACHLVDCSTVELTRNVLSICRNALQEWLDAVGFTSPKTPDSLQVSFHLPLHRYLSVFMCQAIRLQGLTLREVLPPPDLLALIMMHPLRVQVAFYEILSGMWVRNGLQIKGQAMTYIQCNFCNSMVDADLYLLQICATQLPPENFLMTVLEKFHIMEWMSLGPFQACHNSYMDGEHDAPMLESCMTFLATLTSIRTNLGLPDASLSQLEMVTLLCMGDKTHSQLIELMPERCGTAQSRDFESVLAEVAEYKAPNLEASGHMQQGMYVPRPVVWEQLYDPVHVLLRAVHRRDFQTSMDRYSEYVHQVGKLKPASSPWPPFREPAPCHEAYEDPRKILRSRVFHSAAFVVLHKAVVGHTVSEHVMSIVIYLLEMAVITAEHEDQQSQVCQASRTARKKTVKDKELASWYDSDWLSENLRTVIHQVRFEPEPAVVFDSSDSEIEWESSEMDGDPEMNGESSGPVPVLGSGEDLTVSVVQDLSVVTHPINIAIRHATRTPRPARSSSSSQHAAVLSGTEIVPSAAGTSSQAVVPAGSVHTPEFCPHGPVDSQPSLEWNPSISGNEVVPAGTSFNSEVVPSTSGTRKVHMKKRKQGKAGGKSCGDCMDRCLKEEDDGYYPSFVAVNESIISLLLKLHSQLSGTPDSFNPDEVETPEMAKSRIGDGPFFIGKLLHKIAALDTLCRENIRETRNQIWPQKEEEREAAMKAQEAKEREDRRRRAKERQQKLIAEFATKQKQFMERAMETDEGASGMDWNEEESTTLTSKKEYDCVICSQTSPSTEEKPMGQVVLVQASSVLAHKRRSSEAAFFPTCDEERQSLRRDDNFLGSEFDRRVEDMNAHFDCSSWQLSLNIGWDGGVHIQTCGHHLHLDCLKSYLQSLRNQQRQQSLAVDRGEYWCPLCRQLANSVLPLSPQLGECSAIVRSRPSSLLMTVAELTVFLKDIQPINLKSSNIMEAMGKSMEDMTNSTHHKFKQKSHSTTPESLFLFVHSVARTNLEIELVQRGGSLVVNPNVPPGASNASPGGGAQFYDVLTTLIPKRSCIVPLLHVLAVHARVLVSWPAWKTWQQIAGLQDSNSDPLALLPAERTVPLLLHDPSALLTQFVLLLPLHLDQASFACVIKIFYNLLYMQVVAQLTCSMKEAERARWRRIPEPTDRLDSLDAAFALTVQQLDRGRLYLEDSVELNPDEDDEDSASGLISNAHRQHLELQLQMLCLPFLRLAALLRHHLYEQPLPEIASPQEEFVRLVYYLELVAEGMEWARFSAAVALNWPTNGAATARVWCEQMAAFAARSQVSARNFLAEQHLSWHQPRLLRLPQLYDKIFQYYHRRQCSQCHSVPRETSICLLCGTLVCLKESCCKQLNTCEAVQHSIDCGGGTAMYLVVTSSYIIVIRGKRACLWGSVYLDSFGEEDRELKRGKPLYLSDSRYQLLEQQWLAHRFDHTNKKWVWHRDAL